MRVRRLARLLGLLAACDVGAAALRHGSAACAARKRPGHAAARRVEPRLAVASAVASSGALQQVKADRMRGLSIAGSAALGSLIQGYSTGIVGGSLLFLVPHFGLRPAQVGAIATATTVGSVLGTFSAAALADSRLGRRGTMLVSAGLFVASGAAQAWTPGVGVLLWARFVMGVGVGNAAAVVPVYVAECADPELRGALATVPQLFISTGVLLSYVATLLAAVLLKGDSARFRAALGFVTLPALLYAACIFRLPESPRWLLRRGRAAEARAAHAWCRGSDDAAGFESLRAAVEGEERAARARRGAAGVGLRDFSEPAVFKVLLTCVGLQFFQQFAGINAVITFTPQILRDAGVPAFLGRACGIDRNAAAVLAAAIAFAPKLPAMFATMALMDSWGRRRLLRTFVPCMGAAMLALAATLHRIAAGGASTVLSAAAIAAIASYGVFFGLSLGPMPNILTAETFPTRLRSVAMTTSLAAQFTAQTLVSLFFPALLAAHGAPKVFVGFAAVCAAAWVFITSFVEETKNVSLEDIAKKLE